MANNVDVYNSDIVSMLPGSQQEPPLYKSVNADSITDRNSAGEIQAIKLDMTKAENTFIDLRPIFNANQSDGNIKMPVSLYTWGNPLILDGWEGEIRGIYPDKKHTFVLNTADGNTGNIYTFIWSAGVFQSTGKYVFTFHFTNKTTGETIDSKECFFEVEPNLLTMAVNFSEGISNYDSEYEEWKNKVEQEVANVRGEVASVKVAGEQIKSMMQTYLDNTESYADTAWAKKLQQDNEWGGTQTFDKTEIKEFNAKDVNSDNFSGSNMTLDGSLNLTSAPALKYVGGNIARGLMTFEDEFFVATNPADNRGGANFVNGVEPGAGGQNYMNFRVFRIPDTDGKGTHILTEIHANCKIPDSAVGKTIVQFPTSTHMFEGIDQTPFFLGNWILQFSGADKTLRVQGKIDSSGTNNLQDSKMI